MQIKNTVINIITFLVHLIMSFSFFALGYISKNPFFGASPSQKELIIGNIGIISGIILFISSIIILKNKGFQAYIVSVLIALASMISWILVEKSIDAGLFLFAYLIIFSPLSYYKYKLNKK